MITGIEGTGKYFIAIIPPSPVWERVLELKQIFKDQYQSKAALNSPPHITLHMPFEWKEKMEKELVDQLTKFSNTQPSLAITLSGFSCFAPRVIFIRVTENDLLSTLQNQLHRFCKMQLNLFNAQYQDQPFHPHVTVAFRDLKKGAFQRAWEKFESEKFEAEFNVSHLVLLKHDGKQWQPFADLLLN